MEKYNNILRSMLKCSSSFLGNTKLGFMALLWGLLLSGWATNAQGYPVQVIPQVTPPPPIYLSEYADASVTNGPLRVQLLLNDFSISNREVRLRMYFDGNGLSFQSNPIVNGAAPLFLDGGVPLVLTQTDLAPYFQFENISGVSGNAYGKVLAEGSYSVCYEVIDVLTGNALSARTCAAAIVFQNEPPLLVMPYNRAHVEEKNPQNIVFQWTPRHLNVTNVEYQLDIVEVWDNQVDPQQAFLSSPPVFSITTNSTNYVYGPADPLLLSGKRYAWRVTAKALQGTEEIGLFKNQGHSEIYSFSYAGECGLPEGVTYEVKGKSNVNLYWTDFSTDVPEYTIRYRKKEGENNEWFYSKTTSNTTTLWDLTAGTTYEYQIAKSCGIVVSDFTPVDEFTTALENEEDSLYECGIDPNFSVENTNPLASLSPGESFVAGDFPVTVETASGSNGRFTGTGFVRIPYLRNLKVAVEFTNVLVNTDSQLAEGSVRTVYDYENSSILDIDEVIDTIDTIAEQVGEFFEGDNDLDEITVNFPIADTTAIKVQDGNVVITNPANGATVTEPLGDDMVITDSEGNVYHVDAAGNVTKGGIKDSGGIVNADNVSGVNNRGEIESLTAPGIKVTFNTKGTYGMDRMPSGANAALKEEYTIIKDYEGKDYVLTHHAVKKGADTQILANIAVTGNDYTAEDLIFKTKQGETVTKDVVNGETYLKLNGHYTLESETIYAVVTSKQDTTKQLTAGAFTLWHLTERSVDVALVAVNNAQLDNYQDTIDQIFNQGVAQVNFAKPLQISITAEELGGSLDVGDSPFAAAYNAEQKMLINKVKNHPDYNRDTYYILVFNDIPAATGIAGFMPLQRQFGFVFSGSGEEEGKGGDKGKVLAHEMGHGIFALQHPFAKYGSDMENATDWLMDYNGGTGLPHMHWAQIHNPDLKFYTFQDEEDGEYEPWEFVTSQDFSIANLSADIENYTFITPAGVLFTLPNTAVDVSFLSGFLHAFTIANERYVAGQGKSSKRFLGYYADFNKNNTKYKDLITTTLADSNIRAYYGYVDENLGCNGNKLLSATFIGDRNGTTYGNVSDKNIKSFIHLAKKAYDEDVNLLAQNDIEEITQVQDVFNCLKSDDLKVLYKYIQYQHPDFAHLESMFQNLNKLGQVRIMGFLSTADDDTSSTENTVDFDLSTTGLAIEFKNAVDGYVSRFTEEQLKTKNLHIKVMLGGKHAFSFKTWQDVFNCTVSFTNTFQSTDSFVPRCMWYGIDEGIQYYSKFDPAFMSGVTDGGLMAVKDVVELVNQLQQLSEAYTQGLAFLPEEEIEAEVTRLITTLSDIVTNLPRLQGYYTVQSEYQEYLELFKISAIVNQLIIDGVANYAEDTAIDSFKKLIESLKTNAPEKYREWQNWVGNNTSESFTSRKAEYQATRDEFITVLTFLKDLTDPENQEMRDAVFASLQQELGDYWETVAAKNSVARYQQGKIVFQIVSELAIAYVSGGSGNMATILSKAGALSQKSIRIATRIAKRILRNLNEVSIKVDGNDLLLDNQTIAKILQDGLEMEIDKVPNTINLEETETILDEIQLPVLQQDGTFKETTIKVVESNGIKYYVEVDIDLNDLVNSLKNSLPANYSNKVDQLLDNLNLTTTLTDQEKGALLNKVLDLEDAHKFIDDFAADADKLATIAGKPQLVDSWKVLQNTSFSTEIKWLESFDALKKNDLLKYVSDISDAEVTAIHRYTVNNFELTKGAYTGTLTVKQQEWIDLVNSGLDKLRPTKGYQGKVFRGSNRPESEIIEKYVIVYNEGGARGITPRVNEPPLLSTSKNADVAEDFIQRFKSPNNAEVMFEITSRRGVDIDDISDYGKNLGPKNHPDRLVQEEVILSNNQDYEILDVIKSTNTDGSIRYLIKLSE
ncbi:fibronectin type III domain-containing protein [Flavobacterium sp. ASW18X]|uniref:fibronectin type III domain-containing protein n=1 Tax=Flavobacterium sp. ASW18X TaxID=2572595 RepID=UPI0010AE09BA|nr:fibronectin type III domain-containing protein [Flavobacterium sp. ASW18X]TKD65801.1 fibronectin type III domain-containing protein [Flavobacterium sp. ASW18X]